MYQALLADGRFFGQLLELDRELAEEARAEGCTSCGGRLHRAPYRRKPRGGPPGLTAQLAVRESFCCSKCRRRRTPVSLRFFDRKVFFSVVALLILVGRDGARPERLARLAERHSVSVRTLRRWRQWWREQVPQQAWWQRLAGFLVRPIAATQLPACLLEAFAGIADTAQRVVEVLRCQLEEAWPRGGLRIW